MKCSTYGEFENVSDLKRTGSHIKEELSHEPPSLDVNVPHALVISKFSVNEKLSQLCKHTNLWITIMAIPHAAIIARTYPLRILTMSFPCPTFFGNWQHCAPKPLNQNQTIMWDRLECVLRIEMLTQINEGCPMGTNVGRLNPYNNLKQCPKLLTLTTWHQPLMTASLSSDLAETFYLNSFIHSYNTIETTWNASSLETASQLSISLVSLPIARFHNSCSFRNTGNANYYWREFKISEQNLY